jgi:hypothetical protein
MLGAMLCACSSDAERPEGAEVSSPGESPAGVVTGAPPETSIVGDATSPSPTVPSTLRLGDLGLSEEEAACVVEHLPPGVDAEGLDRGELASAADQCTRLAEFGPLFEENLRATFGSEISEAQVACLVDAYGRLSAEDLETVMVAGLDPAGDRAAEGNQIVTDLYDTCEVDPPTG